MSYTIGGILSGAMLGSLSGIIGRVVVPEEAKSLGMLVATGIGVLAVVRESGLARVPLPQLRRQTPSAWRLFFPLHVTAGLWGFDLGLVFTTYLTFAGPWFVTASAVAARAPTYGAALVVAHWLGRACWVWASPYLLSSAFAMPDLEGEIDRSKKLFSRIQAACLAVGVLITAMLLAR